MRKLTTKLAAVVLLLTIMCSLTAFSKFDGSKLDNGTHVDCCCEAGHVCGLHTATVYGEWNVHIGIISGFLFGAATRTRTVKTVCVGCGKTIGSYTETQYGSIGKYGQITWYR